MAWGDEYFMICMGPILANSLIAGSVLPMDWPRYAFRAKMMHHRPRPGTMTDTNAFAYD